MIYILYKFAALGVKSATVLRGVPRD